MRMEMRELKGEDLFSLLSIIGKLDVKDEFVKIFEKNPTASAQTDDPKLNKQVEKEAQKRGMEMAASMLQKTLLNLKNVKSDINELLAELTKTGVSDISALGLKEYTTLIIQFFKKPELSDFFSSIASLLN
ncbi:MULTISPECIES: hypothetical protein [unclassified Enterococcus]|uniref:hypothetical protein n=1 Tax=unclassified Enterococcus TaxID=2608891 RepID=UPI0013EC8FC7|nr:MULTISPECIES: hypothetical protein [unclassified Enterococcus]